MNRTVDEGCPGTGRVAGPAEGTAAEPTTGTVFCGQETPACFLGEGRREGREMRVERQKGGITKVRVPHGLQDFILWGPLKKETASDA